MRASCHLSNHLSDQVFYFFSKMVFLAVFFDFVTTFTVFLLRKNIKKKIRFIFFVRFWILFYFSVFILAFLEYYTWCNHVCVEKREYLTEYHNKFLENFDFFENSDFTKQPCCLSDHLSNDGCPQIYLSKRGDPELSFKTRFVFLSIYSWFYDSTKLGVHMCTYARFGEEDEESLFKIRLFFYFFYFSVFILAFLEYYTWCNHVCVEKKEYLTEYHNQFFENFDFTKQHRCFICLIK